MNKYSVFGGCLRTEMDFPELRPATTSQPLWSFETVDSLPRPDDAVEIGAQHIYGECYARLLRHGKGYRIAVDDTGVFEIDRSGSNISWERKADAWPDFVRSHLLGRVLATSLYSQGLLPLHGSAVEFDSGTVGFLAPKRFGKSTLALALTSAGGRLVTDDTLPLQLGATVSAWPGVHSVRVASDSMAALGVERADLDTREGKGIVTSLPVERLSMAPSPLAALYLISPLAVTDDANVAATVDRQRVPGVASAVALVANLKIAKMTGAGEMPEVLRRAAIVAEHVPVYRLLIPRQLELLPMVAETILGWHSSATASSAVGATSR